MALGPLRSRLEELQVHHCNDFFTSAALHLVACLPALRKLRLEDTQCRLESSAVAQISALRNVCDFWVSPSLGEDTQCHLEASAVAQISALATHVTG